MLANLPVSFYVAWALCALAVWGYVAGPFLMQRMEAPFLVWVLLAATLCTLLAWTSSLRHLHSEPPPAQPHESSTAPSRGTCDVCQTKRDDTVALSCGSHTVSASCLDALRTRAFVELPEPDACPICRAHLLAQQAFMRAVVSIVRAEAKPTARDGDTDGSGGGSRDVSGDCGGDGANDGGEALAALDDALRLDPEHVGALCTQGELLLGTDAPRAAMASLRRALALDGACAESHMHLASALEAEAHAAAAAAAAAAASGGDDTAAGRRRRRTGDTPSPSTSAPAASARRRAACARSGGRAACSGASPTASGCRLWWRERPSQGDVRRRVFRAV